MHRFSQGEVFCQHLLALPIINFVLETVQRLAIHEPAAVQWSACMICPEGQLKGLTPSKEVCDACMYVAC